MDQFFHNWWWPHVFLNVTVTKISREWRWHVTVGGCSHREIFIFCHRNRQRHLQEKIFTVTAEENKYHRNRGPVTVTTRFSSPAVTDHRHALEITYSDTERCVIEMFHSNGDSDESEIFGVYGDRLGQKPFSNFDRVMSIEHLPIMKLISLL